MTNKILKHPSITHAVEIAGICKPLEKLNINYFSHVNITDKNEFSGLGLNPDFAKHYLSHGYYNYDIHMALDNKQLGNIVIWDVVQPTKDTEKVYLEGKEFGIQHTFTIIENTKFGIDCYHFAGNKIGSAINQTYITNLDLLKLFILHFKDKVKQSKELSLAYKMKFKLEDADEGFTGNNQQSLEEQLNLRKSFIEDIKLDKYISQHSHKQLTHREVEVLAWMHAGKTADEIAILMNVQKITINKHVQVIKEKIGCYTQFQLGEFFSKLFDNSKDIIDHLRNQISR